MSAAWGNVTDRVLLSLREKGPGTSAQVAGRLGISQNAAARCLARMVAPMVRGADAGFRRAHITGWHRGEIAGLRFYLRAIYAAGHGHNASKPSALSCSQRNRRRGL